MARKSIFKKSQIPFNFFTNVIDLQKNSANIDLTNEIEWLNCQNSYEYIQNESLFKI